QPLAAVAQQRIGRAGDGRKQLAAGVACQRVIAERLAGPHRIVEICEERVERVDIRFRSHVDPVMGDKTEKGISRRADPRYNSRRGDNGERVPTKAKRHAAAARRAQMTCALLLAAALSACAGSTDGSRFLAEARKVPPPKGGLARIYLYPENGPDNVP